jgi:hypothetical protein
MDAIAKYAVMRDRGATPNEVWIAAVEDNLDWIERVRIVRRVFGLSLEEAKEVGILAMGLADSLSGYQERFIPAIEQLAAKESSSDSERSNE